MSEMPEEQPVVEEQSQASIPEQPVASLAALTLWDVLARGLRAPRATWGQFWASVSVAEESPVLLEAKADSVATAAGMVGVPLVRDAAALVPLGLMVIGLALALLGTGIMASGSNRMEVRELTAGAPWLFAGFLLWVVAGVVSYRMELAAWWNRLVNRAGPDDPAEPVVASADVAPGPVVGRPSPAEWVEVNAVRIGLALAGLLLSLLTYLLNGGNSFSTLGVVAWVSSALVWLAVLMPDEFTLSGWLRERRARIAALMSWDVHLRLSWTLLALVAIMAVAFYFRTAGLAETPPEMTSDHVEKLLDAQRVLDGTTQVFFPNNGGREALQMYLVAIFSRLSGLGMQFLTLKWVSVLEGLLTIPILWWMGREIIGDEQPQLGNAVGLILAALVAVSYWHVALSRLALRIVLTPLIMSLVMIFLARAMRSNRRTDFLKAGVALGIGVYAYQAVRMIPVVVVAGLVLAFVFRTRSWTDRRRLLVNFGALILISVVIFVPLGRFMVEYPNLFWMRTAGRFFGDDIITETDAETGALVERNATLQDRLDAFNDNLPVLTQNVRNVLLMFTWKGDVAWINGAPNRPAMDLITGALFILGLGAWLVRMIRRRDVVDWLILPGIFIMLMPSALSIAFPVENPSATRTSGALPLVYLIAAYGLAVLLVRLERVFRTRAARALSIAIVFVAGWGAYGYNSSMYFGEYTERYRIAAQPYSVTGRVLRGFAESNGSYGNAFMVAYPYWFDHRAIGIDAGRIDWPNGLLSIYDLPQMIRDYAATEYAFDPDRAVLFFYSAEDEETPQVLKNWFPEGNALLQPTESPNRDFYSFIAPPPGRDWLEDFLARSSAEPAQ